LIREWRGHAPPALYIRLGINRCGLTSQRFLYRTTLIIFSCQIKTLLTHTTPHNNTTISTHGGVHLAAVRGGCGRLGGGGGGGEQRRKPPRPRLALAPFLPSTVPMRLSAAAAVRGFWPYVCAGSAIRHWRMAQRPTCRGLNAHLPPGGDRGHVRQCTAAMQHRALMTAYRQRLTKIKPNRTSNTPRPTTALPVPPQRRCATSSLHARHERP
jgi:hypothetical protein